MDDYGEADLVPPIELFLNKQDRVFAGTQPAVQLGVLNGMKDSSEGGSGRVAECDEIVSGHQKGRVKLGFEHPFAPRFQCFVLLDRAQGTDKIQAVELELGVEMGKAEKAFDCSGPHPWHVEKAHVIAYEGLHSFDDVRWESEPR